MTLTARSDPRTVPSRFRLLAAVLVAVAAVVPVVGLADDAGAQGCGPAPSGRVAVAVVVDDGGSASERCVVVPERTDGYAVLRAAGHQLRIESGFLCAIDGFPATGCANQAGFDGSYWRYFHATPGSAWTYSSVGGGGYRMPPRCAIEGWRWSSSGTAHTPPRVAPPAVTCEAPLPTAAPTTPPRPTPPVTAASGATPGGVAPGVPIGPDGAHSPSASVGGTSDAPSGSPSDPAATTPTGPDADDAPVDPQPTDGVGGAPSDDEPGEGTGSGGDEAAAAGDAATVDGEELAATAESSSEAGSPLGLVLAVVLVVGLGTAAWWRTRRPVAALSGSVANEESSEGP